MSCLTARGSGGSRSDPLAVVLIETWVEWLHPVEFDIGRELGRHCVPRRAKAGVMAWRFRRTVRIGPGLLAVRARGSGREMGAVDPSVQKCVHNAGSPDDELELIRYPTSTVISSGIAVPPS